jgi:hypothetical protein
MFAVPEYATGWAFARDKWRERIRNFGASLPGADHRVLAQAAGPVRQAPQSDEPEVLPFA